MKPNQPILIYKTQFYRLKIVNFECECIFTLKPEDNNSSWFEAQLYKQNKKCKINHISPILFIKKEKHALPWITYEKYQN